MTNILIVAEIDGKIGVASIDLERLDWIPYNKGDTIAPDALPSRINKIEIGNAKGHFYQHS